MKVLKQYGIWIALALTLAAAVWVSVTEETASEDTDITAPAPAKRTRIASLTHSKPTNSESSMADPASSAQSFEFNTEKLQRAVLSETPGDLFNIVMVDSEPADTEAVDAIIETPPLPFVYAGKLEDQGRYIIFLTSGSKNYSVTVGDVIDQWQVKSVQPPKMIMSYLPLKSDVPLLIGEVN